MEGSEETLLRRDEQHKMKEWKMESKLKRLNRTVKCLLVFVHTHTHTLYYYWLQTSTDLLYANLYTHSSFGTRLGRYPHSRGKNNVRMR